jgi:hypothetical protein
MIRIFRNVFMGLAVVAMLAAAVPFAAQAEIFIKKQTSQESGAKPSKGIFVPLKNMTGKVFNLNKGKEKSLGSKFNALDIKGFDSALLSSAGGEPRTVQELMMVAVAHNAVKNNALSEMRANNQLRLAESAKQIPDQTSKSQANIKELISDSTSNGVVSPVKKPGKRIFVTPDDAQDPKPRGVFRNY